MKLVKQEEEALGTKISIELPSYFSFLFPFCFKELHRIEKKFSRFLESSELSVANDKLNEWQSVSKEFFTVIKQGVTYKKNTKGSFDMTVKSTLDNLGYDKEYSFTKKEEQSSSSIKKFVDSLKKDIRLDEKNQKIFLRKQIDVGGFGKGYAVDKVQQLLEKKGVDSYVINAGGDMFVHVKKGEKPVKVYLEHPLDNKRILGHTYITHGAIASSSPSRRSWKDGHHLIDAKTKQPAESIKHIFVLADSCMDADAYATALFTAGYDKAIDLSRKLSLNICMLSAEGELYFSEGFKAEFYD